MGREGPARLSRRSTKGGHNMKPKARVWGASWGKDTKEVCYSPFDYGRAVTEREARAIMREFLGMRRMPPHSRLWPSDVSPHTTFTDTGMAEWKGITGVADGCSWRVYRHTPWDIVSGFPVRDPYTGKARAHCKLCGVIVAENAWHPLNHNKGCEYRAQELAFGYYAHYWRGAQ